MPIRVKNTAHFLTPAGPPDYQPAGDPTGGPWTLAFWEDFDDPVDGKPDPAVWRDFLPEGDVYRCNDNASEYEWYSHNRAGLSVHDGMCTMTARYESPYNVASIGYDPACPNPTVSGNAATHTSGMINSQPGLNFRHGYLEARMRFQLTNNIWPAFWGFGSDGAWPGEYDLLEAFGAANQFTSSYHPTGGGSDSAVSNSGTLDAWHTYGMRMSPGGLDYFFDGVRVNHTYSGYDNPAYPWCVIFNLAIQGPIGSPGASTTFDVDYVRFWTKDGVPAQPVISSISPADGIPTGGSVQVSFGAVSGATGYRVTAVLVDPAADGVTASHTGANGSSPVTVTGLTNGKHYAFTVGAQNATGWGIESLPVPSL